jgi:hypothetical protein
MSKYILSTEQEKKVNKIGFLKINLTLVELI